MVKAQNIFHITTATQWQAAKKAARYTHDSITKEGFIHCSYQHQVLSSLKKHFSAQKDLVGLCINTQALQAEVRLERGVDSAQDFPHIYGEINLDAVIQIISFNPDHPEEFNRLSKPLT